MTVDRVRRVFVTLTAMRWLPTGLTVPALVLIGQARGLSLAQIGVTTAIYGATTLLLELPTGGLSDVIGRRPVLVARACLMSVVAALVTAVGTSFAVLAAPPPSAAPPAPSTRGRCKSWFVERTSSIDPEASIRKGLARASASESVALAVGTLAAGAVLALAPLPASGTTSSPCPCPSSPRRRLGCGQVALVAVWVKEPPRVNRLTLRSVVADVPRTVVGGMRLAATPPHAAAAPDRDRSGRRRAGEHRTAHAPHVAPIVGSDPKGRPPTRCSRRSDFWAPRSGPALAPAATRLLRRPSRVPLVGALGAAAHWP